MSRLAQAIVAALVVSIGASSADAQPAQAPTARDPHVVYVTAVFDQSLLTVSLGYGRAFAVGAIDRSLFVFTEIGVAGFDLDVFDARTRLGARVDVFAVDVFALPVELAASYAQTQNHAFDAYGLATELALLPGLYAPFGSVAIEGAWSETWVAYLASSAEYRAQFHAGARDGLYTLTGRRLRIGGRAGFVIDGVFEASIRAGYEFLGRYDAVLPPLYATLTASLRF